jgi:DtxR family transcriptional regulator, Mn-dependent transcriptional regulator
VNDLVDTTEMYLRTILELEEEGVAPLRARIAERLHQSGPTVSQTVARMQRDGLLTLEGDRHLHLTEIGRAHAVSVMRKHRLAELLLVKVIGMPYESAHDEACRWEHVMSDDVERRVFHLLGRPTLSPYGNPIPGLAALDDAPATATATGTGTTAGPDRTAAAGGEHGLDDPALTGAVVVRRICESVQTDVDLLRRLHAAGVDPGAKVTVSRGNGTVVVERDGATVRLPVDVAARVFVAAA